MNLKRRKVEALKRAAKTGISWCAVFTAVRLYLFIYMEDNLGEMYK